MREAGEGGDDLDTAKLEVARLSAILYSVIKRFSDDGANLVLEGIDEDELPPGPFVIGWNLIGNDAIITVLSGPNLAAFIEAGKGVQRGED
jgi:hypothetical protein